MKADQRLQVLDDMLMEPARRGLLLTTPDDEGLNGRTVHLEGREVLKVIVVPGKLVNFVAR
jgi:hypothetical protein